MYKGETRSPVTVILLSIVTCSIYGIYWLYKTREDINGLLGREEISMALFICSIFIPFVVIVFWKKVDDALGEVCRQRNAPYSSNFILWVILLFFYIGEWVFIYQTQENLNKLWSVN